MRTRTQMRSSALLVHALLNCEAFHPWQAIGKGEGMSPEPQQLHDDVLRRVQGEFLEMPGLRLTEAQARRLWGLEEGLCALLLRKLVEAKFLFRTRDGAF